MAAAATLPAVESTPHAPAAEPRASQITPVELYLHTSYRPDQEYIDGHLLERNLGEIPHATLQGFFYWLVRSHEEQWRLRALPEQRVQVAATRFRVPDVCIVPFHIEDKRIVRTAPLVCIEILSPEDRMSEMQERVDDYLRMGVKAVWVVDPKRRKAFHADAEGELTPAAETLLLTGTPVEVKVSDLFAELDRYDQ